MLNRGALDFFANVHYQRKVIGLKRPPFQLHPPLNSVKNEALAVNCIDRLNAGAVFLM